jgi:hypothetical protein
VVRQWALGFAGCSAFGSVSWRVGGLAGWGGGAVVGWRELGGGGGVSGRGEGMTGGGRAGGGDGDNEWRRAFGETGGREATRRSRGPKVRWVGLGWRGVRWDAWGGVVVG